MASLEEIRVEREKKLALLREQGLEPYPVTTNRDFTLAEVATDFAKLSKKKKALNLAGRVRAIRGQGAIMFVDIDDGTGRFQLVLKADELGEAEMQTLRDTVDRGDFIEAKGHLFLTKREEKSLAIKSWRMLAKSLRPLPDKWHGLQDIEERFRRRYLDSLMSPEVKARFLTRVRQIKF